tara:strand:- start:359 stop:781 length:423 start_codon:yes stop_codon:yes gene_type:complete
MTENDNDESDIKTHWTTTELELLCNRNNHKIIRDTAGEYRWLHYMNNRWEIHSIQCFKEYIKPSSWLEFWLPKWNKELWERRAITFRQKRRQYKRLKRNVKFTQIEQVKELKEIYPEWTNQEIANDLGISLSTVQRHLKE